MEELTVDVPTKAVRYAFPCKCWLAKDRGDGLTARFFDIQDAETVNIPQKVLHFISFSRKISIAHVCVFTSHVYSFVHSLFYYILVYFITEYTVLFKS